MSFAPEKSAGIDDFIGNLMKKYPSGNNTPYAKPQPKSDLQARKDADRANAREDSVLAANQTRQAARDAADLALRNGDYALGQRRQKNNDDDQVASTAQLRTAEIDKDVAATKNRFAASEAALDRKKSAEEFSSNQYQKNADRAQGRSNQEYDTSMARESQRMAQDAQFRSEGQSQNAAQALADTNARTSVLGQQSALAAARAQSQAQVSAALFGSRPSYQGY